MKKSVKNRRDNFQKLLDSKKISLSDFCDKVNMSRRTMYNRFETPKKFQIEDLEVIAKKLKCDFSEVCEVFDLPYTKLSK